MLAREHLRLLDQHIEPLVPRSGGLSLCSGRLGTGHFKAGVAGAPTCAARPHGEPVVARARSTHAEGRDSRRRVARESREILVRMLNPMMPHLAEELWERLGHDRHLVTKNLFFFFFFSKYTVVYTRIIVHNH